MTDDLERNTDAIRGRILRACARSGRHESAVQVVAVTKTVSTSLMERAAALGLTCFGENYLQEALPKVEYFQQNPPTSPIAWHFIGKLQSNKAAKVVQSFEMLHSLDRLSLAVELEKKCVNANKQLNVLIEVNAAGELSKSGVSHEQTLDLVLNVSKLCPHLDIRGLMTFPPFGEPESSRPYFAKLRQLAEEISKQDIPRTSMAELSMGISGDFDVAIEEGATMVRLGTVLFGRRK